MPNLCRANLLGAFRTLQESRDGLHRWVEIWGIAITELVMMRR